MKYSVIIPTYNHCADLLMPCVRSVLQYTTMTDVELIISANGCVDDTWAYVHSLKQQFSELGMSNHLKVIWSDTALGYAKANNVAIQQASGDHIVLLNNDCVLLPQNRNQWLHMLQAPFEQDVNTGISGVVLSQDSASLQPFVIFFCVMIDKKVFDRIGLLNEQCEVGGCEDVEFCVEAQRAGYKVTQCEAHLQTARPGLWSGEFPIYHKGQATLMDSELVSNWHHTYDRNQHLLKLKYNSEHA